MSGDAASLPCPICLHTGVFNTVLSLRDRLIFVSTNKIPCPVCQEEISGLDKFTIHLFSHVKIITTTENSVKKIQGKNKATALELQKKTKTISKNKTTPSTSIAPMKYVKIYPKLPVIALNTVPIIDISTNTDGSIRSKQSLIIPAVKPEVNIIQSNNKCNICGLQFLDVDILRMHESLIHNIDDTAHSTHSTFTRYNCHLCTKKFKMRGSLMVHLRVAHYGFNSNNNLVSNDKESREVNENSAVENKSVDIDKRDGKQWQCDVCRKCFTTKYFLKKHKRLHTGETPYACAQCNKTFTFQQSYHKHLLYHNDEKPHTCNFCGRAFKELSTLHNHQRIHTGEKPFACETCGKCFRQRVSYLVHRRIHTGAMPYKCTACEKSFRYKVSQRTHKCLVQPPGTVVRKVGELVEKLKRKQETDDSVLSCNVENPQNKLFEAGSKYPEVSEVNAELVRSGAKLSLEDMEAENFTIISETFCENQTLCTNYAPPTVDILSNERNTSIEELRPDIDELIDSVPIHEKNIPSPSEILKNLCLSNEDEFLCENSNECSSTVLKNYDVNNDLHNYL